MAIKKKATSQLQRTKGLDFRCPEPDDDAWYGVRLLKVKEGVLRVMYLEFPEEFDKWYLSDQFESLAQIDELLGRFRRPAEQLQDSQCGEVTQEMVVLACDTFRNGEILFYDARVDSVSRSEHKSNGDSEDQVCNCQFHLTWRHGPEIGKHATVRAENICLIQKSPIDDPVLEDFIKNARKSLKERRGNLDSQGRNFGLNPAASSNGASPHHASELELIDVTSSDGSHHHEELPVEDPDLEDFIDSEQNSLEERMGNLVNQGGSSGVNSATSHKASPCHTNLRELIDVDHSDGSPQHQVDDVIGQTGDSIGTLGEEKDALVDRCSQAEAEVARLKAKIADMEEQARAASIWEKEKSELEKKVEHLEVLLAEELYFQKETERYEGLLQEEQARAEAEVARLKAEQACAASSWEKEKSELVRKVEHLEEVLSEELYFQKENERIEGLLQELNAQLQIFKAQMKVAKAEREQAILALYEIEAKLKGKRYKVGMSASEWKIPEHLTLPPSETVLSTIRNSQAFAPFRRQIEKEIREHLMKQHNPRSSLK